MTNRLARVVLALWLFGSTFAVARSASAQAPATPPATEPAPVATPAATPPAASGATAAGGPGESCRAKSDCVSGLKCMGSVCRDEMEGASCGARSDCGGRLACVASTCVVPGQSPASEDGGSSKE